MTTAEILEFNKIKEILKTHTQTSLGAELVDEMRVLTIHKQIKYRLEEANEALTIIRALALVPLDGATDTTALIKRAQIGSVLSASEILAVKNLLTVVTNVANFKIRLTDIDLNTPILDKQLAVMSALKPLQDAIKNCIDETGAILDAATPALRSIRRAIHNMNGNIKERMNSLLNTHKDKLTEHLITLRNGRFTFPVKAEYKNSFKGTIHDQSASGHTTYIEPAEVAKLANQLQALQVEEKAEIEKILGQLTAHIASYIEELNLNIDAIGKLDFMFAKGNYAKKIDAIMPQINETAALKLIKARHPLINQNEVVANDIALNPNVRAMIITGPNTGGKTVTIKTVGLLLLMMQSGLLIPAHQSSVMPIFDQIFADIGDEQSIEQSLSTFSSHMRHIVHITENLTPNSLILLDELGSGTDPKEGATLAIALLDYIKTRAKLTIATSHYSELKAYAYEAENVMNASVEFNVDTLSPTYRLLLGIPGRSNAFEIAKKLGLSSVILEQAKASATHNQTEVSELITKIEDKGLELDTLLQTTQTQNQAALALKQEYETKLAKLEQTKEKAIEKARLEGELAMKEARQTAETIIKELREVKKNANVKDHELTAHLATLKAQEIKHNAQFKKTANNEKPLAIGNDVMILSLARQGELVKLNKNGEWTVAIGAMTVNIKADDLQYIKPVGKPKKAKNIRGGSMSVKSNSASTTGKLDLRGVRYEEALFMLDQYFDKAMLANYDVVTIIHGHGTGVIRNAVHKYLKSKPFIADFRFGGESEGGMGATVVTLK